MRFIITTLAEYQTRFWIKVGIRLQQLGHQTAFISFDDRSSELLRGAGLKVFSGTQRKTSIRDNKIDHNSLFFDYGIGEVSFWLTHERIAFSQSDTNFLVQKLANVLEVADTACKEWSEKESVVVIQELGGFLSVIGSYFAARKHGFDHYFIEPSFFRSRLFFVKNKFAAINIPQAIENRDLPVELAQYLDETVKSCSIVVPEKDRHQYTSARKKLVNCKNACRLFAKLRDKYILGKSFEFGYIGHHVRSHAEMLLNSVKLKSHYTETSALGRFVYYPLHVPGDVALTLRSPHLLDQIALIDFICRSVPTSHQVAIKEHPAMVGAIDSKRLIDLLKRYDNLVILTPSTNNYEVLRHADVVVSVNSKSGAEAGLLGKRVIVLGDAFYIGAPFAIYVDRIQDLPQTIENAISGNKDSVSQLTVQQYFRNVWENTAVGELYLLDPRNVENFTKSLISATVATS